MAEKGDSESLSEGFVLGMWSVSVFIKCFIPSLVLIWARIGGGDCIFSSGGKDF